MTTVSAYFYDKDGRIIRIVSGDKESVEYERSISSEASILNDQQFDDALNINETYYVNNRAELEPRVKMKLLHYNNDVPVGDNIKIQNLPINTKVTLPSGLSEIVDDGEVVVGTTEAGEFKFIVDHPGYLVEEFTIVTDPPPEPEPETTEVTDAQILNWDTAYGWGDHSAVGYLTAVDWAMITGKPATATRWPDWSEVTGKPTTFAPSAHTHPWTEVTSKPATATRWPAWSEVTTKPSTFPPSSHTHHDLYSPDNVGGYTLRSASSVSYTGIADGGQYDHLRGGSDQAGKTYAAAVSRAAALGVRLPTIEELEANIASGTGGGFDATICWTCSPVPGKPGYVYAALGKNASVRQEYKTDGTNTADCRFVANVNVPSTWHADNDGTGSGLDADTVDGIQGSSFLRSNANDSFWGVLTKVSDTHGLRFENTSYPGHYLYIGGWTSSNSNSICRIRNSHSNLHIDSAADGDIYLNYYSNGAVRVKGSPVLTQANEGAGNGIDADTVDGQHASAFLGATAKAADSNLLDGINSSQFLRSDTTDYLTGVQYLRADIRNEDAYRDHGVYGHYNSNKINHIWSMGSAYRVATDGANFGDLYGLAYKHTNNTTGGTMAGGHQMVWCHNGTPKSAMGTGIWTSGSGTATDWHATSDIKFKKDIRPLEDALSGVLQLRGVRYKQKADEEGRERIGVIAQEMEKVYPEFVVTHDQDDPEKAYKTVNYPKLTAVLVEAIKEQNQTIENQQAQLDQLEAKLNKLLGESHDHETTS